MYELHCKVGGQRQKCGCLCCTKSLEVVGWQEVRPALDRNIKADRTPCKRKSATRGC